ncbi:F-box only protein 31-like [Oratosquilla oratoria]|uniref:F-box only protein 31-like n=1 Tax=Oratosquilla oratoria TaxID=337810 RepID=UPI003F7749FD
MSVLCLPDEILHLIFKKCDSVDSKDLKLVCKRFLELQNDDALWKYFCVRDYGVSHLGPVESFQKLYTELLWRYGDLLGLFQAQIGLYGALFEVKYENGKLLCIDLRPSEDNDMTKPLEEFLLFTIDAVMNPPRCMCASHPQECIIRMDQSKGKWFFYCQDPELHATTMYDELGADKFRAYEGALRSGIECRLLHIPGYQNIPGSLLTNGDKLPDQIFAPGLFKSSYGLHGIEIIMFKYENEKEIHGIKVTGDVNVCASQITVKAGLRHPVTLTDQEQKSLTFLRKLKPKPYRKGVTSNGIMPFFMPENCDTEGYPVPARCSARYFGCGQIAEIGFRNPNFTPVHLIIFSNDLIGVLWLKYNDINMYERIDRVLTESKLKSCKSAL